MSDAGDGQHNASSKIASPSPTAILTQAVEQLMRRRERQKRSAAWMNYHWQPLHAGTEPPQCRSTILFQTKHAAAFCYFGRNAVCRLPIDRQAGKTPQRRLRSTNALYQAAAGVTLTTGLRM